MKKAKDAETLLNLKVFRSFIIVTVIMAIFGSAIDIINTIFLRNFYNASDSVLASKSISDLIITILRIIPVGFAVGSQKKYAAEIAKGDADEASKTFSVVLIVTFLYSLLFSIINFFLAEKFAILITFDGDKEFINQTTQIIKGMSIGLPFMFVNTATESMLVINGSKKTVLFSLASTILVSILGNSLVVFIFKADLFYIFLVTSIAYLISMLINLTCLIRKKSNLRFNFKFKDILKIKQVFIEGLSGNANHLATALISTYMNFMLLYLGGSKALDIWGLEQQVILIASNFVSGFFSYAFLIDSIYGAEDDLKSMQELFYLCLKIIIFIVVPLCIISVIYVTSYVALKESLSENNKIYIITCAISCAILTIFDAFMYIAAVFCNLKQCICIYLLSIFILPVIFSLALSRLDDVLLFIIGYAIGRSIYPLIHIIIALIKFKTIPIDVKRLFFFPSDYGYDENDSFTFEINSILDCMKISNKVYKFCEEHNVSKEKTNMLASCAEEMSNIYVMSGFTKDLKKHYCSLKISIKNNEIRFRMRDDCPFFLSEKIEDMSEKDPICNVSYKILLNNAEDIKYSNFFNMNNFIIYL